jgi:hypothetical protein
MPTRSTSSTAILASLVLVATASCGGGDSPPPSGSDASIDAPAEAHDGGAPPDAPAPPVDGGPIVRTDAATGGCAHEGFPRAFSRARADDELLHYSAIDNLAGDPTTLLWVQRFYSLGAVRMSEPQIIELRPESYADCSTCVLVLQSCTLGATLYDASACDKIFLARAGTVELTYEGATGEELLGFLHDVELVEVEIDPDTFESTVVPGGETWCIPSYTFETEAIGAD